MKSILSFFVIVSVSLTLYTGKAVAAESCVKVLHPNAVQVILNNRIQVINFAKMIDGVGRDRIPSSELEIPGKVVNLRILDGHFNPLLEVQNMELMSASWIRERMDQWKSRVFDGNNALHYTTLERLVLIRQAKADVAQVERIFRAEFMEYHNIIDDGSGLFSDRNDAKSKNGARADLNQDGSLKSINFGSLSNGLYEITVTTLADQKRNRQSFVIVVRE